MSNTPSDEEIDAFLDSPTDFAWVIAGTRERYRMLVREVLAKWGTPQPVVREPLSDAQIAELMRDTWGCASIAPRHAPGFARAVERAHGITQKGGAAALDCHHRPPCDECAAYDAQGGD